MLGVLDDDIGVAEGRGNSSGIDCRVTRRSNALESAKDGSRSLSVDQDGKALVDLLGHNALLLTSGGGDGASTCFPDSLTITAPSAAHTFGNRRNKR